MANYNTRKKFYQKFKKFRKSIKQEKLTDGEQFVSFGIMDICPSLLEYYVLSKIKNRLNDNKFVTSIDKRALIELEISSIEFMSFAIDYNQMQGLFIGAATSPCFADIYIERVEESHIYTMLNVARLWYRKVDDTFAIISHDRGETLQKLNDFNENIEFTTEKAS